MSTYTKLTNTSFKFNFGEHSSGLPNYGEKFNQFPTSTQDTNLDLGRKAFEDGKEQQIQEILARFPNSEGVQNQIIKTPKTLAEKLFKTLESIRRRLKNGNPSKPRSEKPKNTYK